MSSLVHARYDQNTESILSPNSVLGGNYPTVYVVSQSAIPFIIPVGSTIGNNGAFSSGVSMPFGTVHSNSYVFFPAGALFAGSLAGWYYTIWSSATVATVYADQYTQDQPIIPNVPTPIVATGPGAFVQLTTEIFFPIIPVISNGLLGPNGSMTLDYDWSITTSAGVKTLKLYINGNNTLASNILTSQSSARGMPTFGYRGVYNRARQTGQAITGGSGGSSSNVSPVGDLAVTLSLQNAASNTDIAVLESFRLFINPEPKSL